jgi:predicted aldo/keto reductase-like oxidoreductase
MKRREFLTRLAGAAAVTPLMNSKALSAEDPGSLPTVTLGNTGITTTRMAQGTGFNGNNRQSDQTRAGFEKFVNLMRHGYDRGIRFFDLADQYGSHYYFREALRFIPREDVTILSKFQYRFDGESPTTLKPQQQRHSTKKAIDRFRLELNVDVLDILLMHAVVTPDWTDELAGFIEVLQEHKEKGIVKALGMSCHTLDALKTAAKTEWVQVALTRINPEGISMDGSPEEVIPVQRKFKERGACVMGMKIYGGGQLVHKKDECMRFAQNLGYLDAMTLGATTPQEVDESIRLINKYPAVV